MYNVHSLLHSADNAVDWVGRDTCSGFAFVNYLQSMKEMVYCGKNSLSLLTKRIQELDIMPAVNKPTNRKCSFSEQAK